MRTISVVILNYGTPDLTIASAKSVLADLAEIDGELVIVDNASPDESVTKITAWIEMLDSASPVSLITSPENSGYSGGNNLGLRARQAEFYVLLNSDTLVRPGAFHALLAAMRANPEVGVLGPQLIAPDETVLISRFRRPSPTSEFVEATGADFFYRMFHDRVVPIGHGEDAKTDWIGFPCVMLRKRMIDEIGFLDDRYFMYFEDVEYCRRATRKGWRLSQSRDAKVVHFCGQSSKFESMAAAKERLPAYYYASRSRYLISEYGRGGYAMANMLWYFGRFVSYCRLLTLRAPSRVCAGRALDIWISSNDGRQAKIA